MKEVDSSTISNSPRSPCRDKAVQTSGFARAYTFDVEEGTPGWSLFETNTCRDPIPPEPVALNEARLLCRQAMTLITEEVSTFRRGVK
jgi:hypothetical protein